MKKFAVAIDGPSGAGKSSIAKKLAQKLSIVYVDTGAIYRAVGLYVYRKEIDPNDSASVIDALSDISVNIEYTDGTQHILLNGEDVSGLIRTETISRYASRVSAIPQVREFLLSIQRDIAERNSVVMDGRDIGTVILPKAEVKIFLTASNEVRAMRRYKELVEKGEDVTFASVLSSIIERDKNDSSRDVAPLKPAEDAVLLDSSELNVEQTIDAALSIIGQKVDL